jgi:hypothetical protein
MTSGRRLLALAVVTGFLLFLPGCHRGQGDGGKSLGPQYIMLTYNNGSCQQNGAAVAEVDNANDVIYQGAASISQFQINFASCPFASANCPVNSPNGTSVNVGRTLPNASGNYFQYTSVTIGGQQCTNGPQMGIRVKGGP